VEKIKTMSKIKATSKKSPVKMSIAPLADRVLVKPLSADELSSSTSPSGIIIPDTVDKEKPAQGIIVAVGDGRFEDGKKIPMSVKVGDRVVFSKYGYDEIKYEGEEYYILTENNILAVIK